MNPVRFTFAFLTPPGLVQSPALAFSRGAGGTMPAPKSCPDALRHRATGEVIADALSTATPTRSCR